MPAGARAALQQHLRAQQAGRPRAVASGEPRPDQGALEISPPDGRAGEAILRDPAGAPLRLRWPAGGEPVRFPLAPGRYRFVTYRVLEAEGGWHLSATGEIATVELAAGQTASLVVTRDIHLSVRAPGRSGQVQVQVSVQGERGSGLTIYRHGRREPLGWLLVAASGESGASGPLRYG